MAVQRSSTPVGLVGQIVDVLVVVLGQLKMHRGREAVQEHLGEEVGLLFSWVNNF